jgi:hypothetical protein
VKQNVAGNGSLTVCLIYIRLLCRYMEPYIVYAVHKHWMSAWSQEFRQCFQWWVLNKYCYNAKDFLKLWALYIYCAWANIYLLLIFATCAERIISLDWHSHQYAPKYIITLRNAYFKLKRGNIHTLKCRTWRSIYIYQRTKKKTFGVPIWDALKTSWSYSNT